MKRYILLSLLILTIAFPAVAGTRIPNFKSWDPYPDVSRISAKMLADLLMSGEEEIIFVYAGYKKSKVICSSVFLPYNKVPPFGSGSSINLPDIPKETLMAVY